MRRPLAHDSMTETNFRSRLADCYRNTHTGNRAHFRLYAQLTPRKGRSQQHKLARSYAGKLGGVLRILYNSHVLVAAERQVMDIPLQDIRRPLSKTRENGTAVERIKVAFAAAQRLFCNLTCGYQIVRS